MKTMKKLALVLCMAPMISFAGCGEHEAVKEMNTFADEVCACKDMKCVTDSTGKLQELAKKYAETKVSQSDADKIKAATEKATKCISELPGKLSAAKPAAE